MGEVLGDLAREARQMTLRGFGDAEIGRFIAETTASAPAEGLVRTVGEATGGNPFFVNEVVRLLSADARWTEAAPRRLPVPPSVRATIRGGQREPGTRSRRSAPSWPPRSASAAVRGAPPRTRSGRASW
jgi:hypothetical protein